MWVSVSDYCYIILVRVFLFGKKFMTVDVAISSKVFVRRSYDSIDFLIIQVIQLSHRVNILNLLILNQTLVALLSIKFQLLSSVEL